MKITQYSNNVIMFSRVGSDKCTALSQPTISRCIQKYTRILTHDLSARYVQFPRTQNEIEATKRDFLHKFGIPGAIGLVDGTHIKLSGLKREQEHRYVNRNGDHSLNVQIVCNAKLMITSINARFPGSNHDAYIYSNSRVNVTLENLYRENPNEMSFLIGKTVEKGIFSSHLPNIAPFMYLGDSAYPLTPWLMKIFPRHANLTRDERRFNKKLSVIRSTVERCIGILKGRWRCLSVERALRYSPINASYIVNACAVLHNFLINNNYNIAPNENLNDIRIDENDDDIDFINANNDLARGIERRNELVDVLALLRLER